MAARRCILPVLRQTNAVLARNGFAAMPTLKVASHPNSVGFSFDQNVQQCRGYSVEAPLPVERKILPKKETLLAFDWVLEGLAPIFMKAPLKPFFEHIDQNVEFEDKIYGYKSKGLIELGVHITKVRLYFRYKSPYNRTNYNGSYLFEDDDYVVLLWGLETMDSNIWNYLPSFITGRKVDPKIIEGALVFTVGSNGKVTKIVNRPIEEKDINLAKEFVKLKKMQNEEFDKEDRRAAEKELKEQLENERRQQQ